MATEQKTETEKSIQQMLAFIKQEARDEAEEIEVRAKEHNNLNQKEIFDQLSRNARRAASLIYVSWNFCHHFTNQRLFTHTS